MKVIMERYPYRYVETGTLENGFPDYRIQKQDYYTKQDCNTEQDYYTKQDYHRRQDYSRLLGQVYRARCFHKAEPLFL